MTGHGSRGKEILGELMNAELFGGFDTKTCQDFINWFTNIDSSGKTYYRHEFETLCESDSFFRLCEDLYLHDYHMVSRRNIISLKSLDGVATSIDMRVVAAESEVLSAFTDRGGGRRLVKGDEIPLKNLSGKIVSEITHFMNKKHDFSRELKNLIINYKGWCTQFLKLNRTMLSDLNEAAEFLGIKSLFKLTGRAVMELGERSIEEITEWCGRLSFSEMLSSLVVGVEEDLREREAPSLWPFA
ncbi:uncharacterized protein LOC107496526 [Arachis duranensis]|uniref:Uncharacterized protein LOC107496526 n=1 Tax=Arachis duranensis TaxID=130453 RepID=A0A6P4DWD3_ARADU|nr:uncharacterized protein LOC107496526 [Arachis duranensis]